MNISSTEASPPVPIKEVKPVRRGNLPFKKRQFFISSPMNTSSTTAVTPLREKEDRSLSSSLFSNRDCFMPSASEERIAALALVAAAVSVNDDDASDMAPRAPEEFKVQETKKHGFSLYQETSESEANQATSAASLTTVLAAAADLQSLDDMDDPTSSASDSCKKTSATHRVPLTRPLPHGCHGRTSRNNSYCRRSPCYNGSKYCKLHYQHYLVSGSQTMVDQEPIIGEVFSTDGGELEENGSMARINGGTMPMEVPPTTGAAQHQDKRYTGCPTEVKCNATTTRGRDCSYCAVNGTKYCYLHADYDTNPPPRRGGACAGNAISSSAKVKDDVGLQQLKQEEELEYSSSMSASELPKQTKRKCSTMSARRLSTAKNLEKRMADAPYPLLSTLGTDKWFNRKVVVSTGPLANHVGVVEKWGNGWVSVRLPGVGLHNRRSFELYLLPGDSAEEESLSPGMTGSLDLLGPSVEVFDTSKASNAGSVQNLRRSISSDNETSPPAPLTQDQLRVGNVNAHEVTPLTSCRVIGINNGVKGNDGPQRMSSIMFPASMPETVPESPVPTGEPSDSKSAGDRGKAAGADLCMRSEFLHSGKPQRDSDCLQGKFRLPVKSFLSADNEGDEIPLVESLMLAQEGRVKKHKLGLLFGTAALERSRRNIHKPTRYEDTELIAKKTKKRDRESSDNGEYDVFRKRRCHGANAANVISSSDEESSDARVNMVSV